MVEEEEEQERRAVKGFSFHYGFFLPTPEMFASEILPDP